MFAGTRPGPTEISNGPSDWARECEVASVLSTHTRGNQFVNGIGHTGREDPGDTEQSARAHTCNSVNERDPWKTPASTWEIGRAPDVMDTNAVGEFFGSKYCHLGNTFAALTDRFPDNSLEWFDSIVRGVRIC